MDAEIQSPESPEDRAKRERREARERERDAQVAKWRAAVLAHVPAGRYLSLDAIERKVEGSLPGYPRPTDAPAYGIVAEVLDRAARDGTLYRQSMERGYDYAYAKPTPKLREEKRREEEKRRVRRERAEREEAAEKRATAALAAIGLADAEGAVEYSYGHSTVEVPTEALAALLASSRSRDAMDAADALRALLALDADAGENDAGAA